MRSRAQLAIRPRCFRCFRALAAKARFAIFTYLVGSGEDVSVSTLVKITRLRQPTVTFHLKQLEAVGLVRKRRAGKSVYCYSFRQHPNCPLFV